MSSICLSKTFQADLKSSLEGCNSTDLVIDVFNKNVYFLNAVENIKKILREDKYIRIKGFPFGSSKERVLFESFVRQFGEFYGMVEFTGIKVDCNYTGCSRNALTLHNDDAIDLQQQPKYGFIQVVNKDPIYNVENGVVIIRELIRILKFENKELLNNLLSKPIPMLSYGVNYDGAGKEELITNEPILRKTDLGYKVRFDFDRNKFYYQVKGIKQHNSESKMIYDFLKYSNKIKKTLHLDLGDILIHDNHETLHDRGECSIEFDSNGRINTREILVSFVR